MYTTFLLLLPFFIMFAFFLFLKKQFFRIKRLANNCIEVYKKNGSLSQALSFLIKTIYTKTPLIFNHFVFFVKKRNISMKIKQLNVNNKDEIPIIAVKVSGGIGDLIVIARFLRDLNHYIGGCCFDIYHSNINNVNWIFKYLPGFRLAIPDSLFDFMTDKYDLAMYACQFVIIYEKSISKKIIFNENLMKICDNIIKYRSKIDVFINNHPYMDNALSRKAVYSNSKRMNYLHFISGIKYGGDLFDIDVCESALERFGLKGKTYVTVHNGFDTGFVVSQRRATKCYPHFGIVIRELKKEFPDIIFVQVGSSTSEEIEHVDYCLIGKTSLKDVASIIKGAIIHIDNEGGLVHLSRCFGVRSCVLFGPTPSDYFAYPDNINIDPPTCGGCWWIDTLWMSQCPRGFLLPPCMYDQNPLFVFERIKQELLNAIGNIDQLAILQKNWSETGSS